MRGFNQNGVEDLTKLVESLGVIQKEAEKAVNNMITPELEAEMTEGQKIMMNDLKQAINLDGCDNLSSKLEEINSALKKHNLQK